MSVDPESRPVGRLRRRREAEPRRISQQVLLTEEEREQLRTRAGELGVSVPRLLVESALSGVETPAERRAEALAVARTLRGRGFKVETYHAPQKLARQLSYAEKKGIPFVWFPPFEAGNPHEIKNMTAGTQIQADPETWVP